MDIKPTNLTPVLPGSTEALPARDARADLETLHPGQAYGVVAPETGATPQRAIDASEARIGSDPWAGTDGARMLTGPMPLSISQAGETAANAELPDAVRTAVDLVFSDPV